MYSITITTRVVKSKEHLDPSKATINEEIPGRLLKEYTHEFAKLSLFP